jgi:hypothetical protein
MSRRCFASPLLAFLLWPAVAAPLDSQWVVLDPELHRFGNRDSIERQGPWTTFAQGWGDISDGRPSGNAIVERMAVNCLTGAYGQTQYPSTDEHSDTRVTKRQTFSELEHAQDFDGRLVLNNNSTPLGRALMEFACTCQSKSAEQMPTADEIQVIYDRYIAEPLSKVEYHLKFLRVKSERLARAAIAKIAAGKSFDDVFDEFASPSDAVTFPHGDLGPHAETEFAIDDVRRYRALQVGDFTRVPHEGLYGWEIVMLTSKHTIPAPSLTIMRPRIQAYLSRAHACGWTP